MGDKGKIVLALGGNALQDKNMPPTAEAQLEAVKKTCRIIAEISKYGYEIAIVHGNGPQVGRLLLAGEAARDVTPPLPFDVCAAMSQGYIGYHLQLALKEALRDVGKSYLPVVTLITQVVVDSHDPAFTQPTKPIGPFYSAQEAANLIKTKGYVMKEDAGRGWRRVVASPRPLRIVEGPTIKRLWDSTVVITCGGGGIPAIENEHGHLEGVAAVIDKDYAAELLAEEVHASTLVILTEVDKVSLNFNRPSQHDLDSMSITEAERYIAEGHFPAGSMLPKVEAGVLFARSAPGRRCIITSLYQAFNALLGENGTVIYNDRQ